MKKKLHFIVLTCLFALLTSCGSSTDMVKIPGVTGPYFNVQDGKVILTITFDNLNADFGATVPIPKLPNSDVTVTPVLEGGTLLRIGFDPKDVENDDFRVVPAETLPDGRPFPFTAGGTLPALAINTPKLFDTTFYVSDKLFGFFIPVHYPLDVSAFTRIKINGKNVGLATIIKPNEYGTGSGVMLILTLDALEDSGLQNLLKMSRKNPSRLY